MRILHIIPRLPYFGNGVVVGGAANSMWLLASEQAKGQSVDVVIAASFPRESRACIATAEQRQRVEFRHIGVWSPPRTRRYGLEFTARVLPLACTLRQRIDVVHGHSGAADYMVSTAFASLITGGKGIHTVHCPIDSRLSKSVSTHQLRLITWASRTLSKIVAVSSNVAQSLVGIGVPRDKIVVIPPPVDTERYRPKERHFGPHERPDPSADAPTILFVGSTKSEKNLETAIRAMADVRRKFPDARLVVTLELSHSAEGERTAFLNRLATECGLHESIQWIGIVPNMQELMSRSSMLIAPFLHSAGPSDYFIAALEAMACGKPVLVSRVGAMPTVVDDQVGALCDPLDAQAFASAAIELLGSPREMARRGKEARRRVEQQFNPATVARRIAGVYQAAGATFG